MKWSIAVLLSLVTGLIMIPAAAEPAPCSMEEYRQFDFWLGKWTASSAEGQIQGTNHIHRIMGTCAIQENWTGATGQFKGTSYSFYSPASKSWHQTWVDNNGGQLQLEGTFTDGQMQLEGRRIAADGKTVIDRIVWTPLPDGRVRQHWQSSQDEGLTWTDVFDGYYQKDE